jgi:phosphoribosylanthranilate isomerase
MRAGDSMRTRVKICGNTDVQQVRLAADAGADAIGIVVEYPVDVPWNLTREEAPGLFDAVPPFVTGVMVTGGGAAHVLELARVIRPQCIQLHTDNPIAETREIARELRAMRIALLRALRIDADQGIANGEEPDPIAAATELARSGVSGIVLDAQTSELPAGTGVRVDWELAARIRESIDIPLILAGGLTPANVDSAIRSVRPYGVDVISGVEAARRMKNPALVRAFVSASHTADL